jgi:hypothetical protein
MFKRIALLTAALFIFTALPTLAAPKSGCNLYKFTGSFTRPRPNEDVLGDGNLHSYVNQLNLTADGGLSVVWTAAPDYMINAGTGTPYVGSWTCRADGKLLINFIYATFIPIVPAQDPTGQITTQDIRLANHFRVSQLWTVDSDDQITVVQSRTRKYAANEDPTNPTGGALVGSTSTNTATYTRLIPTDADLLAPPVTP